MAILSHLRLCEATTVSTHMPNRGSETYESNYSIKDAIARFSWNKTVSLDNVLFCIKCLTLLAYYTCKFD